MAYEIEPQALALAKFILISQYRNLLLKVLIKGSIPIYKLVPMIKMIANKALALLIK